MRRLANPGRERGAVAVVVAIWMVVLIGFTAIAVDLASAYSERQQLQNGADAAALAIASSCLEGTCVDSADTYAKANKLDALATGTVVGSMTSPVTVKASYTRPNWFAGVLGVPTTDISASASAEWGYVSGGATLPIAFSWCEFFWATGGWDADGTPVNATELVIMNKTKNKCSPPAHSEVPGGFGWLDGVSCRATIKEGNWVSVNTGNDGPNSCTASDWVGIQGKTVLIPIYDEWTGTGSNGMIRIKGVAAFKVTGYYVKNQTGFYWNWSNGNEKGLKGFFSSYVDVSGGYTIDPSATSFGVGVARLTA